MAWETGNTVAQRVEASAQSRFDWKPRTYTFGLAEFTDDRFSGYRYEAALSAGSAIDSSTRRAPASRSMPVPAIASPR